MPNSKPNPFFSPSYQNPALGGLAQSIASLFAQQPTAASPQDEALATQRNAAAMSSVAQAGKYGAETSGIQDKNSAMRAAPSMLAELFLNGGQFQDDPLIMSGNADAGPAPANYGLDVASTQATADSPIASMFAPTATARDRMGMAIQEHLARGGKMDDFAKILGQAKFYNEAAGGTPDEGMPFMPLFGSVPTTSTALTTGRQDQMSARDAGEAQSQAMAVARQSGENSARVAGINQAGAMQRQLAKGSSGGSSGGASGGSGGKPTSNRAPKTVDAKVMRDIKAAVASQAQNAGFGEIDPSAMDFLSTEVAKRYQETSNIGTAVASLTEDLISGNLPGVSVDDERVPSFWKPESMEDRKKVVKRSINPAAPTVATKPVKAPSPAAVKGLPSGTKIGRSTDKGWEVRDASGKLIGYVQE